MIVEDDPVIAKEISAFLASWDFNGKILTDFYDVLASFQAIEPDLVLMDISLPYKNGYYWTEQIRTLSKVPIIFISSMSENMNIVMALSQGGDDFIAKPFDLQILMMKIKALLRRTYDYTKTSQWLECEQVRFNLSDNVVYFHEQSIELTKNEAKILRLLMEQAGKIVSREMLMEYLWKTDYYVDENALSVNINRLRKKLERIQVYDLIKTKKGIGYKI